ncbi:MAG: PEP-CTERM sorting domain-containing protein [Akkermansia sp.]|nr:PEP-CTERM sorting domain-containing protein [Akkermansia sp.]
MVLSFNSADGSVTIKNTQAVPEPTSATLSLLALAGLCARRRRK